MAKLFIEDLRLEGRRVLMRVDFNVPVKDARIEDDTRVRASLPSIRYVLARGASLVLMSHLGRPDGQRIGEYSLGPVAERLQTMLGTRVTFLPDCVGPNVERACTALKPGEVILLENLRSTSRRRARSSGRTAAPSRLIPPPSRRFVPR
jgi:phosphoglycerate kinase